MVIARSLLLDAPRTLRWHEEELPAPKADQIAVWAGEYAYAEADVLA